MIARFLLYRLGSHQIDWEILGGLLAIVVVLWIWGLCRLAATADAAADLLRRDEGRE